MIARAPYGYGGGAPEERIALAIGCCNALIREGTTKAQGMMGEYEIGPSRELGARIEAQLADLDHLEVWKRRFNAMLMPC